MKGMPKINLYAAGLLAGWLLTGNALSGIAPWKKDVAYGGDNLQKLDIYLPGGEGPFPCIIQIHGGGWWNGDKQWQSEHTLRRVLAAGCAYIPINYRFLPQAAKSGIFPPVRGPFHDARLALQFTRAHSAEWNLDPERVALTGGSAGGCTALWLALSPDMADAQSANPVERQSTRVRAVGVVGAQTSLDPRQMREWVGPELKYGGQAFGLPEADFGQFLQRRAEFEKYFSELSPAALVNAGSPPIYLAYAQAPDEAGKTHMFYVHSPQFGVGFQKLARERGAICHLAYPGLEIEGQPRDVTEFLLQEVARKSSASLPEE
jgi:acetyl esterase/lipase